jgi:hypothetical protein
LTHGVIAIVIKKAVKQISSKDFCLLVSFMVYIILIFSIMMSIS